MNQDIAPSLILVKTALDKLLDEATIELATVGKATAKDEMVFTQDTAVNAGVNSSVISTNLSQHDNVSIDICDTSKLNDFL